VASDPFFLKKNAEALLARFDAATGGEGERGE
jgi:hypothetical protein